MGDMTESWQYYQGDRQIQIPSYTEALDHDTPLKETVAEISITLRGGTVNDDEQIVMTFVGVRLNQPGDLDIRLRDLGPDDWGIDSLPPASQMLMGLHLRDVPMLREGDYDDAYMTIRVEKRDT